MKLAEKLANLIEESIKREVSGRDVAVSFSGGIDSTTLAFVSKKYANSVTLYSVGFPESKDIEYSLSLAEKMDIPINIFLIDKQESIRLYNLVEEFFSLGFLKSEILAPIQKIFEVSKEKYILFGSGSEELFAGYERYYEWKKEGISEEEISSRLKEEYEFLISKGDVYYIRKLAEKNNKTALFPFCDNSIAELALNSPVSLRLKDTKRKKYLIREAAKILGVPEEAIERPKKALQYGTGIHKVLLKLNKAGKLKEIKK